MPDEDRPFLRPGLVAGLCAAAGAVAGLRVQPAAATGAATAGLALAAAAFALLPRPTGAAARAARRIAAAAFFACAAFAAGLLTDRGAAVPALDKAVAAGEQVRFVGQMAQPVERRLDPPRWRSTAEQPRLALLVDFETIEQDGRWTPARARVLLSADDVPLEARAGDEVEGRAWLRPQAAPANPGQEDRGPVLHRNGIAATGALERGALAVLHPSDGFARRAEVFRGEFAAFVRDRLGDRDRAALVAALSVGERGAIATGLNAAFNASGLAHVLSISGLHLAVAVAALAWLLRRLFGLSAALSARVAPRRLAAAVALPVTAFYVALIGAPAPAVRAGIGLALVLGGRLAGRVSDTFNTLGWALAAVAVFDTQAIEQPSTQMSFLGVAGLAWLTPRLREMIPIRPPEPGLSGPRAWLAKAGEAVLLLALGSIAATLASAPLTAIYFERASLVAAAANLVAWPASTLVVPAGAAGAALFALHPALAGPLVDLAGLCAGALAWCARLFGSWPAAAIHVAPPSAVQIALYAGLVVSLASLRRWPRRMAIPLAAVSAAGLLVSVLPSGRSDGRLEVAFLSVGQGDSTVVRFPGGSTWVVDAGGDEARRSDTGARIVAPFLRERGVRRVDRMIASHPHPDHIGGFPALIDRFAPRELWVNDAHPEPGPLADLILGAADAGARVVEFRGQVAATCPGLAPLGEALPEVAALAVGDPRCSPAPPSFEVEGVRVEVLHPLAGPERALFPEMGENDDSLVLRLTLGSVRILLPGDLEREGEALLLARGWPVDADILKAPHHGSGTSSTEAFVRAVRPAHVVFPVGAGNRWGFPSPAIEARYAAAGAAGHRTDRDGAVVFRTDGRVVEVTHHLGTPVPDEETAAAVPSSKR